MKLITELLSNSVSLGLGSSNYSFNNRQLLISGDTKLLMEVADSMWNGIKHLQPECIFGTGVGASPLLTSIKLRAYMLDGVDLRVLFIRDARKTKGTFNKLVEGATPKEVEYKKSVFIDDLYNYGNTFNKAKQALFDDGFNVNVVGVAVMVDFWMGSRILSAIGFPFYSIVRRHDLGLTRIDNNIPSILNKKIWEIDSHHTGQDVMPIKSMPVIHENKVYIGNDNTNQYCYNLFTGDLIWKYESMLPSPKGNVSVAQFSENNIFWSAYDGVLRCAEKNTGNHIWATKLDSNLHSSPELDPENDRLFIGTEWDKQEHKYGRGDIVSVDMSTGNELWRVPTDGMVPATPLYINKKNIVVCGSNDFHVYFMDASSGKIISKIPTKGEVKGKPSIDEDNSMVVFSTNLGYVYGVSLRNNDLIWERRIGSNSVHGYPIVENDRVFVTNTTGHVLCLNLYDGNVLWLARTRGNIGWGLTNTESRLFACTTNGYIVTIDKLTGSKLSTDKIEDVFTYQPLAYDEKTKHVIVSSNKGLYCYEVDI